MSVRTGLTVALALSALCLGCDSLPGKPVEADRYQRPVDVLDFDTLYAENCSGCHGADGRFGPARPLNDPLFLAIAGADAIVKAATTGTPGTPMPAAKTSRPTAKRIPSRQALRPVATSKDRRISGNTAGPATATMVRVARRPAPS